MDGLPKPTLKQIKKFSSLDEVVNSTCHVFHDAQLSLSGHRKLVMFLRNIQIRAVTLGYEEEFNFHVLKMISKILKSKKGVTSADRIVKFCSSFVATMLNEEAESGTARPNGDDDSESVLLEFVDLLIRHLLRGIESRFKEVRFRVVQLLAYLVNYITEIDEQLFKALQFSLSRRLQDKEPIVRIQAVVAISRFQFFQDDESDSLMTSATSSLLNTLRYDESAESRRAALLNLSKSKHVVPLLLERARDTNAINRRLVYLRILKEIDCFRDIDIDTRDKVLSWGLNDRDESVRLATTRMLSSTWLEHANNDVLRLLEQLHVINSDVAESVIEVLFTQNPEILENLEISDDSWRELTVEKALFIRVYYEQCLERQLYDNIEKNIPELIRLAHILEDYLKLRTLIVDSNSDLVERYKAHENKKIRFSSLLKETSATQQEIARKVAKEEHYLTELKSRISETKHQLKAKRDTVQRLNVKKSKDTLSADEDHELSELRMEYKTLQNTLDESISAAEEVADQIKIQKAYADDIATKLKHQAKERESYEERTGDLEEEYLPFDEQIQELEFIINQLLLVIQGADFADVAGTRRVMPIVRNALTAGNLSDKLISTCVSILRKSSNDESYFSSLCTEIITDIRDSSLDEADETFVSAASMLDGDDFPSDDESQGDLDSQILDSNKRRKTAPLLPEESLMIQCLLVLRHYLEILNDPSSNIYQIETLIETLIRPAISNSANEKIRLLGYQTLGLLSLIDKGMGKSNLKFFGMTASKAQDEQLKVLSTKIVFDILSTHGVEILDDDAEDAVDSLSLARLFYSLIKSYDMPNLQAVVAEGLCKLLLADLLQEFGEIGEGEDSGQESKLLEILLVSYFNPINNSNTDLKQILAFCLPVYAWSHEDHQKKLSMVSGDCFYRMYRNGSEYYELGNLPLCQAVLLQLINWGDPSLVGRAQPDDIAKNASHFWQAMKFLQIVDQDSPRAVKRAILLSLPKLRLSPALGSDHLQGLRAAIEDTKQILEENLAKPDFHLDTSAIKGFAKFESTVAELLASAVEAEARVRTATSSPMVRSRASSVSETQQEEPSPPAHDDDANADAPVEPDAVARELDEIDEFLDAEDRENYDVPMDS